MRRILCRFLFCILLLSGFCGRVQAASVQVTYLSDLALGAWSIGDPAVTATMDVCVYASNTPAGSYGITLSSPGGFVLTSGANHIPYSLYWDDAGAGNLNNSTGTQLTNAVDLTAQANAYVGIPPGCGLGGPSARLIVKIAQADLTAALAGTYTGTITFLLSPT